MDDNKQGQGQQQAEDTKGSGHRGDQGEQSRENRLEHDGHEFPRTGESTQGNSENQQQGTSNAGQSQSESDVGVGHGTNTSGKFDDAGQGDPSEQERSPMSSSGVEESHDSWRPTADPAAGDMAPAENNDDQK